MSESEVRMGVSDARANLTEVINKVRLLGQQVVLTRREKPQAALVSPDWYEQALTAVRIAEGLREMQPRTYQQLLTGDFSAES